MVCFESSSDDLTLLNGDLTSTNYMDDLIYVFMD
jgi:hypothetical protein